MIYVFGEYELDTQLYELRRAGTPCALEPKAFNVLAYLAHHRDEVVTRQELLDNLWPEQFISEGILNYCIKEVRKAVGDSGREQRVIKTVHGRGYRFIASVEVHPASGSAKAIPVPPELPTVDEPPPIDPTEITLQATPGSWQSPVSQDILAEGQTVITVLCGTLDNVSILSERLGFDALQRLRQTFFALAQDELQRYGGTLRFFGADGILGLFGAPVVHADHARRAVLAALGLRQRLDDQLAHFGAQHGGETTVRMGLHTGPVALDDLADDQWLSSPDKGETTNLAVWLQYLAAPGMLLTSETTMLLVQDVVQCMKHGPVRIPGQLSPFLAYKIYAPRT